MGTCQHHPVCLINVFSKIPLTFHESLAEERRLTISLGLFPPSTQRRGPLSSLTGHLPSELQPKAPRRLCWIHPGLRLLYAVIYLSFSSINSDKGLRCLLFLKISQKQTHLHVHFCDWLLISTALSMPTYAREAEGLVSITAQHSSFCCLLLEPSALRSTTV